MDNLFEMMIFINKYIPKFFIKLSGCMLMCYFIFEYIYIND